ncbi:hypothetical protein ACPEGE_03885 [Klebsiella sp. K792]|uniref:hypothetical protein n=1 Tax=Klebsiella sp. K792 TaxID=3369401 RepID=UPI003C2F2C01
MTTDITKLAQRMKAAAVRAKAATEDYVAHRMSITVCLEECKEFNDLSDGPDNVLALVEALELKEEQRANWFQMAQKLGEDLDAAEKRNAELESRTVKLPPKIERDDADGWLMYKGGRVGGGAAEWYNKALDDVGAELTAAGIKWEAE